MIKRWLIAASMLAAVLMPFSNGIAKSVQQAAEKEFSRHEALDRAKRDFAAGNGAFDYQDYATAAAQFQLVCDAVPESPAFHDFRAKALEAFCKSSVLLARQQINQGSYTEADATLKKVLGPKYHPDYAPAVRLLAANQLLVEADAFYNTGQFKMAYERYKQFLEFDPYNIAAHKGLDKANEAANPTAPTPASTRSNPPYPGPPPFPRSYSGSKNANQDATTK